LVQLPILLDRRRQQRIAQRLGGKRQTLFKRLQLGLAAQLFSAQINAENQLGRSS